MENDTQDRWYSILEGVSDTDTVHLVLHPAYPDIYMPPTDITVDSVPPAVPVYEPPTPLIIDIPAPLVMEILPPPTPPMEPDVLLAEREKVDVETVTRPESSDSQDAWYNFRKSVEERARQEALVETPAEAEISYTPTIVAPDESPVTVALDEMELLTPWLVEEASRYHSSIFYAVFDSHFGTLNVESQATYWNKATGELEQLSDNNMVSFQRAPQGFHRITQIGQDNSTSYLYGSQHSFYGSIQQKSPFETATSDYIDHKNKINLNYVYSVNASQEGYMNTCEIQNVKTHVIIDQLGAICETSISDFTHAQISQRGYNLYVSTRNGSGMVQANLSLLNPVQGEQLEKDYSVTYKCPEAAEAPVNAYVVTPLNPTPVKEAYHQVSISASNASVMVSTQNKSDTVGLIGSHNNGEISTMGGNDTIYASALQNGLVIDGGSGTDTLVFSHGLEGCKIKANADGLEILTSTVLKEQTVHNSLFIKNIENFDFNGMHYTLDQLLQLIAQNPDGAIDNTALVYTPTPVMPPLVEAIVYEPPTPPVMEIPAFEPIVDVITVDVVIPYPTEAIIYEPPTPSDAYAEPSPWENDTTDWANTVVMPDPPNVIVYEPPTPPDAYAEPSPWENEMTDWANTVVILDPPNVIVYEPPTPPAMDLAVVDPVVESTVWIAQKTFKAKGQTTVTGNTTDDAILGNAKNNTLKAGGGDDLVKGAGGHDHVLGQNGHDTLLGGSGNDKLNGGQGNDLLQGGKGNDVYFASAGHDIIDDQAGKNDVLNLKAYDLTDVSFSSENTHDLVITLDEDASITIIDYFASPEAKGQGCIEKLMFEGGALYFADVSELVGLV